MHVLFELLLRHKDSSLNVSYFRVYQLHNRAASSYMMHDHCSNALFHSPCHMGDYGGPKCLVFEYGSECMVVLYRKYHTYTPLLVEILVVDGQSFL